MFVIVNDTNPATRTYYSIDRESGGYGYWSAWLSSAKIFKTMDEAVTVFERELFGKRVEWSDGSSGPPRMVHGGLGLCNDKLEGSGTFRICEIKLDTVRSDVIAGKLDFK